LVRAVENAAPIEEVLTYQKGGIFAREAVTTAPQRRVDVALRHMVQGAYKKTFNSPKAAELCLAEEIMAAARNDQGSFAVSERTRKEKEAIGAR
jgi:small subunit ribosomal protein S7